jgi:hypothetical protein
MAAWIRTQRPRDEFWRSSPAQVEHVFRAHGMIAQRGSARDFMAMAAGLGVPVERG